MAAEFRTQVAVKDQFRSFFFTGLKVVIGIFLFLATLGITIILINGGDGAIFKAIGMAVAILWACIFLSYFVWGLYFYNINYGKTDYDWERIYKAKEDQKYNLSDSTLDVGEPQYNPHRDQTFGMPPGTVRGMIAFTLLFGAIAMLIISMGMNSELDRNSFFWDHYEFYKTAFLMMIAFYFGSKSLEFLQQRFQKTPQESGTNGSSKTNSRKVEIPEESNEEAEAGEVTTTREEPLEPKKKLEALQIMNSLPPIPKIDSKVLEFEFKQITDYRAGKVLTDQQITEIAEDRDLEYALIKSVITVESAGRGFLSDARPKILFEGHKFWSNLKDLNIDPNEFVKGNENILYPKWTRNHYLGGIREYERLNKAMKINREAAIYSASWGLFQILGENIKSNPHYVRRHETVEDFYDAQFESEYQHLLDFLDFISNKKIKGEPLLVHLKAKNWDSFAYGYNGSGYKTNNYHLKLEKAYNTYKVAKNEKVV